MRDGLAVFLFNRREIRGRALGSVRGGHGLLSRTRKPLDMVITLTPQR
jgi:hypothetical protein